jgi:hypothetical protein
MYGSKYVFRFSSQFHALRRFLLHKGYYVHIMFAIGHTQRFLVMYS